MGASRGRAVPGLGRISSTRQPCDDSGVNAPAPPSPRPPRSSGSPGPQRLALVALTLVLVVPWVFNPSWGPSPMVMQTCLAAAAAVVWFVVPPPARGPAARLIAAAWLLGACFNAGLALVQYFGGVTASTPWASAAAYGEAYGNLRQRNQLATLLALGLASAFYLAATTQARALRLALAVAVVLMSSACAVTSSRTGLLQWVILVVLLWATTWRGAPVRLRWWALLALAGYAVALSGLPALATWWTGVPPTTLIDRMASDLGCVSRKVLWSNALYLASLQPWTGWGLGEMDYAHHVTLYPGERFCLIVDNAHNLFLHAAVELGIPFALVLAATLALLVWKGAPWKERAPERLLAWAALGAILLHSQLEFPLWYGPFELAALLALSLLLARRPAPAASAGDLATVSVSALVSARRPLPLPARLGAGAFAVAVLGYVVWDYFRVSQLFMAETARLAAYRTDTLNKVRGSRLFADQVRFAEFTTTSVTAANAAYMAQLGEQVLHYSPEPQVVERLLEAWSRVGRPDRVTWHLARFEAAFPEESAAWKRAGAPADGQGEAGASTPQ